MSESSESDEGRSRTTDDQVQYVFESVKAIRGKEGKTKAERLNAGWELVSESRGAFRTEMTFRRKKPGTLFAQLLAFAAKLNPAIRRLEGNPAERRRFAIVGGGLALIVVVGIAVGAVAGDNDSEPAETAATQPTQKPTAEPSETDKTVASGEAVDLIKDYIAERAAAGVVIAKAVTKVSLTDRVLRVTFDPATVGMSQEEFDFINPFNNPYDESESLADFVSSPMAFNTDVAERLRQAIDKTETKYADGAPDGSRTTAKIIELNELD